MGGVGVVSLITPPMYISMVEEATDILKCTFQNHLLKKILDNTKVTIFLTFNKFTQCHRNHR